MNELLRVFAAVLAGANFPLGRFFLFNVLGGITWAIVFGAGGYLLGRSFRRVACPLGWLTFAAAAIAIFYLWRYYKHHEEQLLLEVASAARFAASSEAALSLAILSASVFSAAC